MQHAQFTIGQIIHHLLFDYRGVIIDVDGTFQGSEEWYNKVALSRPAKEQPWYHILVDQAPHMTYVAESNLRSSDSQEEISHPQLEEHFSGFENGIYQLRMRKN